MLVLHFFFGGDSMIFVNVFQNFQVSYENLITIKINCKCIVFFGTWLIFHLNYT